MSTLKRSVRQRVISSKSSSILKYMNPNHPDANDQGYVACPDVNVMKEMADMIGASKKL